MSQRRLPEQVTQTNEPKCRLHMKRRAEVLKCSEAGEDIAENYLNFVHTTPVYTFMILVVETLEFYFTHNNCVNLCQFHRVSRKKRNKKMVVLDQK